MCVKVYEGTVGRVVRVAKGQGCGEGVNGQCNTCVGKCVVCSVCVNVNVTSRVWQRCSVAGINPGELGTNRVWGTRTRTQGTVRGKVLWGDVGVGERTQKCMAWACGEPEKVRIVWNLCGEGNVGELGNQGRKRGTKGEGW